MNKADDLGELFRRRADEQLKIERAEQNDPRRQYGLEDFAYDKSLDLFWDVRDLTLHKRAAINACIPKERWRLAEPQRSETDELPEGGVPHRRRPGRPPSPRRIPPADDVADIERGTVVEASTWWPGHGRMIYGKMVCDDGMFDGPGNRLLNTYRPPPVLDGDPSQADPWLRHVQRLYPEEQPREYLLNYLAHTLQHPEVKINGGVVLSGRQGIGKDTLLTPVRAAVGTWNCKEIEPGEVVGSTFNPWRETVLLVINEARPHDRQSQAIGFYNALKPLLAAPPDVLRVNQKHIRERYVRNVMRVIITTNDWNQLHVPEDDRRLLILVSPLEKGWHLMPDGPGESYFSDLNRWFASGGTGAVSAWLRNRDLSGFDPKAEPPETEAKRSIQSSWGPGDDLFRKFVEEYDDEHGRRPEVIFSTELRAYAEQCRARDPEAAQRLADAVRNPRQLMHLADQHGYVPVRAPNSEGRWNFNRKDPAGRITERYRASAAYVSRDVYGTEQMRTLIDARGRQLMESTM